MKVKIRYLFFLVIAFFCYTLNANLTEINRLGFSESSTTKIMREINELLEDTDKMTLDFSGLGAPQLIDPLLRILYMHLYPFISDQGPIINKDCINVNIMHIDLSSNELTEFPTWLTCFPRLKAADLSGNLFPYWVKRNIALSERRVDISV